MEIKSQKLEIENIFSSVRTFSFNEKKSPLLDEEKINALLDAILDFKDSLKTKNKKIYEINERIEKITWLNDLDDECLMIINDLISAAKDLRTSLIRQYVYMNYFRKKGVAKEEIGDFKDAVDELKETYEDLESIYFFLPEIIGFKDTTKKLSLV